MIKTIKRIFKGIGNFVILRVDGGLGSVILQYALGLNITQKTGKKVKFDGTWFEGDSRDCDKKWTYRLLIKKLFPNIDFELASKKEIKFYKKYYYYANPKTWVYNDLLFKNKEPIYYDGYYSHYRYWADTEKLLQKNLDFSGWELNEANKKMKEEIENSDYSIGIHIRRGDFVNLGWCCIEKDYYIKGIKYIQEKANCTVKLFFFSNDMEYVKNEILPEFEGVNYTLVDINDVDNGHFDMYLLSLCRSQVIANSTFSICAALLNNNDNKIVIAPDTWGYNIGKDNSNGQYDGIEKSIQNPKWVILNHETGDIIEKTKE